MAIEKGEEMLIEEIKKEIIRFNLFIEDFKKDPGRQTEETDRCGIFPGHPPVAHP